MCLLFFTISLKERRSKERKISISVTNLPGKVPILVGLVMAMALREFLAELSRRELLLLLQGRLGLRLDLQLGAGEALSRMSRLLI